MQSQEKLRQRLWAVAAKNSIHSTKIIEQPHLMSSSARVTSVKSHKGLS